MLKTNKKILSIDYGDKSIGMALYDIETDFFVPYKTIYRIKKNILRQSLREIVDIVLENNVIKIVLGLPLNEDDTENDRSKETYIFKELLEKRLKEIKKDIKIELLNEYNTTYEATEYMKDYGLNKDNIIKNIDTISALVILKDYINNKEVGNVIKK